MFIRSNCKIGKSFLRRLTGVQENFKIVEKVPVVDWNNCVNCTLYKTDANNGNNELLNYCMNFCKKCITYQEKITYYNESNRYLIPRDQERLSKSQIKQLILYHFLNVDRNGFIKNISEKELASYLGCTLKTVRANNIKFVKLNYILFARVSDDIINICLLDYKRYFLSSYDGGRGYLTMHKDLLDELLAIKNVNALRLEIRELIKFDDININAVEIKPASYSYVELKRFLPRYINYRRKIVSILNYKSNAFELKVTEKGIEFKLNSDYIVNRKELESKYTIALVDYLEENNILVDNKALDDLIQMSIQYDLNIVIDALNVVKKTYFANDIPIENLGGLVRHIIKEIAV